MKTSTIILFILGLILTISGFFLSNADNIPRVFHIVAPDYMEAMTAMQELNQGGTLKPNNVGFEIISGLFVDYLRVISQQPEIVDRLYIEKIEKSITASIEMGGFTAQSDESLRYTFSNGQTLNWKLRSVESEIDKLKNTNIFRLSVILFIAGILIQIWSFIQERHKRNSI